MNKNEDDSKSVTTESVGFSKDITPVKSKVKNRGKKRKRRNSQSSSENDDVLAENSVEVDRSLHATAIKNNLDETSVRKIIKKVVTNDRVLALVKMREEEDSGTEEDRLRPKLTRAKVKELMKVSPKTHATTAWNLENLELTPIKHIPVKTRPEVKALIAQELPEDEDDEEYEPTNDDVPSDDDQGLESCSDIDSQPRTPATPRSLHSSSPKVIKDGPFKVPQDVSTPTRRKLDLEEEATIALRTRSKLSLSSTSIEHIESTFVPPDDIPMPAVDDLWNQFLNECLNPASTSKNEDDDETDPEYNVAADPDAHDEDEESLGNSIIKISKKELNDLVTELFNIIPESTADEDLMADNLASSVLTEHSQTEVNTRWEGKREPTSDDENENRLSISDRITFEKKNYSRVSQGKSETQHKEVPSVKEIAIAPKKDAVIEKKKPVERRVSPRKATTVVRVCVREDEASSSIENAPPLLQENLKPVPRTTELVHIQVNQAKMLPEQITILQQQLRMHVQLATSSYLQLYVHPIHWSYANKYKEYLHVQLATSSYLQLYVHPIHWSYANKYKEYLEAFSKMTESNPKSVVNVCNLQPAIELITTWEKTVSANTPENQEMIKFILSEAERCKRRGFNRNLYVGEFHETFMKVVTNSPVFLYPYLLPAMPFRGDTPRRFCYLHSEDQLIALGMEQFWQYVRDNPQLYKQPPRAGGYGLSAVLALVAQHMMPWLGFPVLLSHVQGVRKHGDKDNPINIYMKTRTVAPVKHKLLPYNPQLTLYEQPENEVPRIFARYLAKTSKRFRNYLNRRSTRTGVPPVGVDIQLGQAAFEPSKEALPIQFSKPIVAHTPIPVADKFDIQITDETQKQTTNFYKFVETSTGAYLLPLTNVVMINPNSSTNMNNSIIANLPETSKTTENNRPNSEHCTCCIRLRKICRQKQTAITDYFGKRKQKKCSCQEKIYPKVSSRLRLLVNNYKYNYKRALHELQTKISMLKKKEKDIRLNDSDTSNNDSDLDDIVYVTNFHLKLLTKTALSKFAMEKKKLYRLFENFNPVEHDAVKLAVQVEKACGTRLEDLYKEFLCFLTPEQADKINAFKDYFRRNCTIDLIKKVEEHVKDLERQKTILTALYKVFTKNLTTACEMCTDILVTLDGYPTLAQYVYSLFPHRKETSSELTESSSPQKAATSSEPSAKPLDQTNCDESTLVGDPTADYEADMSMSSEEEDNSGSRSHSDSENNPQVCRPIKQENTTEYVTAASTPALHTVVTVSKTEDISECSNSSMQIMFEDEVKTEQPEWRRNEDKLILEILKEQLTPEERRDKTILDLVDDKNIIDLIADSLTDKSKEDIRTRILYLLQIV
ncbi:hypothetical protein PYW07_005965 [Mythimna separata]|uniref:GON-4-like protein n=1 Tax=Mythimna separata TaxID=271217 RepID=A0AAD8DSL1_MYTSE|nr:hypothetical protein PYW07_005965 [Mythimna separata]